MWSEDVNFGAVLAEVEVLIWIMKAQVKWCWAEKREEAERPGSFRKTFNKQQLQVESVGLSLNTGLSNIPNDH